MFELRNGMMLYHGSYCEVRDPDLTKCVTGKDFGKGFYLTTSEEQAIRFITTSVKKAKAMGGILTRGGYVSKFSVQSCESLRVLQFLDVDTDWLRCVTLHRKGAATSCTGFDEYDLIVGKIADDRTNATLTAYLGGAYGDVGSEEAAAFCIKRLKTNHLCDQYCFRTEKALACLRFEGSEEHEPSNFT